MFGRKAKKIKVLFVDDGNDLQSQIAEYFLNKTYGDKYEGYSAGPNSDYIDCDMISVMYQEGYDIRSNIAKDATDGTLPKKFDYIVYLQRATYELIGANTPSESKVILEDFGTKKDFTATDEEELYECYLDLIERVKDWVKETFVSVENLDSNVL